ncbi:hypothetical protein ACB094_02G040400 [Castanea mollissima]
MQHLNPTKEHSHFRAGFAILSNPRHLISPGPKRGVSSAASPAGQQQCPLPWMQQFQKQSLLFTSLPNHRSGRHFHHRILAFRTVHRTPLPVAPLQRSEMQAVSKRQQRVHRTVDFHVHVSASASVAAGRTSQRHVLLATERDDAVSAVACLDVDFRAVETPHHRRYSFLLHFSFFEFALGVINIHGFAIVFVVVVVEYVEFRRNSILLDYSFINTIAIFNIYAFA